VSRPSLLHAQRNEATRLSQNCGASKVGSQLKLYHRICHVIRGPCVEGEEYVNTVQKRILRDKIAQVIAIQSLFISVLIASCIYLRICLVTELIIYGLLCDYLCLYKRVSYKTVFTK